MDNQSKRDSTAGAALPPMFIGAFMLSASFFGALLLLVPTLKAVRE
jgi:hypothetical protein